MANNTKNKSNTHQKFSEKKYLKERMRQLPIGKCYMEQDWKKTGMCTVIVTRLHAHGTFSVGVYLVDTFCLGVKKTFFRISMDKFDYDEMVQKFLDNDKGMSEASYEQVHNMVWGGVAWAEEAGIRPEKTFELSQYVLEEDTDDIPLIEYEYGKDGKHALFVNDELELARYLPTLRKHLGEERVTYSVPTDLE